MHLLAVCTSFGAVVSGCTSMGNAQTSPPARPTVAAATATRADLANTLTLTAEFESFQDVDVMAKVSGYVHDMRVDIGDHVRAGALLATLDVPEMADDFAKASAALSEAAADLASAQEDLERAKVAHDIAHISHARLAEVAKREAGLVPQQDLDEARSRDLVAEAQVATALARRRSAEQHVQVAEADRARVATLQHYAVITAPFDGVVTKRYANVGALIQAGTSSQTQAMPVVRLSQNTLLRLIVPVPESAAGVIAIGQRATVRVRSLKRTFEGRVTRFANKVQTATRTMDTEIDVPNPSLTLIPGMYAEAELVLQANRNAVTVPIDAIDGLGSSAPRVFVVGRDGTVRIVKVATGLETATQVEVVSGLSGGETVVVGRHADLTEGERVQPRMSDASVTQQGS